MRRKLERRDEARRDRERHNNFITAAVMLGGMVALIVLVYLAEHWHWHWWVR